jgi:hypothetical protein
MPTEPLRIIRPIDHAAVAIGVAIRACEDNHLVTFLKAYGQILKLYERRMSDAETIQTMPAWYPSPLQFRMSMGMLCLKDGLHGAATHASEKGWRKSDSYIRALARSEASYFRQRHDAQPHNDTWNGLEAEYKRLSVPEGWR